MCGIVFFVNFAILNKIIDIMNTLDLVILAVIVISAIYGYYKGILSQLGSIAGVFLGIICCRLFGDVFASFLTETFAGSTTTAASTEFLNNVITMFGFNQTNLSGCHFERSFFKGLRHIAFSKDILGLNILIF